MELIKAILLEMEDSETNPLPSEYPENEVLYHIVLCIEAKLLHGQVLEYTEIRGAATWRLTWEGHEFLDAARNATVWKKTLSILKQNTIDVPFTILKAVLVEQLKERIGLDI